jgi:hypothetical protein
MSKTGPLAAAYNQTLKNIVLPVASGWPFNVEEKEEDGVPPEHIDVGTAPTKVQCAWFGGARYQERVEQEIEAWIPHLKALFGEPPLGCSFKKATIAHEGGSKEIIVRLYYRPDYDKCVAYASKVRDNLPEQWENVKDSTSGATPLNTEGWLKNDWVYMVAINSWSCKRCGSEIVKSHPYFYHKTAHTSYNLICPNCHKTLTGA